MSEPLIGQPWGSWETKDPRTGRVVPGEALLGFAIDQNANLRDTKALLEGGLLEAYEEDDVIRLRYRHDVIPEEARAAIRTIHHLTGDEE